MKHISTLGSLIAVITLFQTAQTTVHTMCYNYFMETQHCVSAANAHQCNTTTDKSPSGVQIFKPPHHHHANTTIPKESHRGTHESTAKESKDGKSKRAGTPGPLNRRYENTKPAFTIGGGKGVCGNYTSDDLGACLWKGRDFLAGTNASTAGWLDDGKASNCRKLIYVQRKGETDPSRIKLIPVIDACTFNLFTPETACQQLGLTKAAFELMKPTKEEAEKGIIESLSWDFANIDGNATKNGPV